MSRLPGPRGLDNLRWSVRLVRDWFGTPISLHQRFGPVVHMGFGPFAYVYVFGAEANEAIFRAPQDAISWHDAMAMLIPVDGETAIVVSDGEDHTRRRRIVQPAFSVRRLNASVDAIADEACRALASWVPGSEHDAYDELRACIRRIVMRVLFGDEFRSRADEMGAALEDALAYVNRPPWKRFDHDWPGTPYRRAMRARATADAIAFEEIARRRAESDVGDRDDTLSWLIAAQDDAGALTDQEVRDQIISLVAAGYDTTSAAAGWLVWWLAQHHDVRMELMTEIDLVVGDEPVTAEHLQRMPWLLAVVNETLRLGSPAIVAGRKIERPFNVLGYEMPAGRLALYSAYVTHRIPELWPEPLAFRPGRWIDGHRDHHEIVAGSWVPFGGGPRRCLGFALATIELQVLAVELMRSTRGEFTALRDEARPSGVAAMVPESGVPIRVG